MTASSISSTDIRMMMTFFRLRKMPKHAEREQARRNRQVMSKSDGHSLLAPGSLPLSLVIRAFPVQQPPSAACRSDPARP